MVVYDNEKSGSHKISYQFLLFSTTVLNELEISTQDIIMIRLYAV